MTSLTGGQAIARALKAEGIEVVLGIVGRGLKWACRARPLTRSQ